MRLTRPLKVSRLWTSKALKNQQNEYKTKFEESEKNHVAELSKISYNSAAEKFIDGLKPKDGLSKSAILAEFMKKEFKLDGETLQGAKEWAESFKKDNAAHFDDGTPGPGIFQGPAGGNLIKGGDALRAAFGLPDTTRKE